MYWRKPFTRVEKNFIGLMLPNVLAQLSVDVYEVIKFFHAPRVLQGVEEEETTKAFNTRAG